MWEVDPDVLVTDLGDELILMHAARGLMFSLNAAGRAVWLALPGTPETVAAALMETFEVNAEQAEADVRALLSDLTGQGMVRRR